MGRYINTFNIPAGFNINGQEPIDSRIVVDSIEDLTNEKTWEGLGLYNGLIVSVLDMQETRMLVDRDNYQNISSWVMQGGSGGDATITKDIKTKDGDVIVKKGSSVTEAVNILTELVNNSDDDISFSKDENGKFSIRINGIGN